MKRIMKLIKEKLKYVFKNRELYQATAWQFMPCCCRYTPTARLK